MNLVQIYKSNTLVKQILIAAKNYKGMPKIIKNSKK